MDTLFKEMITSEDFLAEIDINVDIVFTIDATESLCPFMEKIKYFMLSCEKN